MNKIIRIKEVGKEKTARLPIKLIEKDKLSKPSWIKMKLPSSDKFHEVNRLLKENQLNTVCEEASCPNIGECYSQGTATFMILGEICTRRCPFCDVVILSGRHRIVGPKCSDGPKWGPRPIGSQ